MKQKSPYTISMGKFCKIPKGITVDCDLRVHTDGSVILTVSVPAIIGSEILYFGSRKEATDAGWLV